MFRKKTVFIGLSGGVDSSVSALLLKRHGYNVVGVHLRSYNVDGCGERDAEDARRVAEVLNIPFYVFDYEEEYKERVVQYMVEEYRAGRTPNPDVMCNREIKFGLFYDRARRMGADFVATGHYVRRRGNKLFAARDKTKDQSYFLWTLTQSQIPHLLFPLGRLLKKDVRRIAKHANLPTAEKKDSQGVCFLGQITLKDFLSTYIPERKGAVVDTHGHVVGEHPGMQFFTIGQRHGLGSLISSGKEKNSHNTKPHYIAAKDAETNTLVVVEGSDDPMLYRKEIELTNINQLTNQQIKQLTVHARVRYRQPLAEAKLIHEGKNIKLVFTKPQRYIAAGQSTVWYSKKGEILGGGIIQ